MPNYKINKEVYSWTSSYPLFKVGDRLNIYTDQGNVIVAITGTGSLNGTSGILHEVRPGARKVGLVGGTHKAALVFDFSARKLTVAGGRYIPPSEDSVGEWEGEED